MPFLRFGDKEDAAKFAQSSADLASDAAAWGTLGGLAQGLPGGSVLRLAEVALVIIYVGSHRLAATARRVADDPPRWDFGSRTVAMRYRVDPRELGEFGDQTGLSAFVGAVFDADASIDAMRRSIEKADGAWLVIHGKAPEFPASRTANAEASLSERLGEAEMYSGDAGVALRAAADAARRLSTTFAQFEQGARLAAGRPLELDDAVYALLYRVGIKIEDTRRALRAFQSSSRRDDAGRMSEALRHWLLAADRYGAILSEWHPPRSERLAN